MTVAVDAMGGDRAPAVVVEGAVAAARDYGLSVTLVGQEAILNEQLIRLGASGLPVTIAPATQVVGMGESPADSLRRKKDSSVRIAFDLVRKGQAEAVVSAGNSGATLATAMVSLGRMKGIRPAIATLMPTLKQPAIMIDVGANVDCRPHHLLQFGIMGAVFSREILGLATPRVGLLSIGEEDSKGNQQVRRAYDLLASSDLKFVGNVEGREVFRGDVDVIVCDGFVGNICLKLSEGLAESVLTMLRTEIESSLMARLGYFMARSAFRRFRKRVDYAEYGGAPLLGINGVGIICHGRSEPRAIRNAIRVAHNLASVNFTTKLADSLEKRKDFLQVAQ